MRKKLAAYILAGGKSRRMGEDKGLILLHGKPVIQYMIHEIKKVTGDISIVTSNDKYRQFNLKIIEDFFKDKGPAAGIDAALQNAQEENIFITSCDMPFVDEKSIRQLLQHSDEREITLIKNENHIEPMFAIYKKKCAQKWRELLLQNTFKLSDFISQFDTNFVNADKFLASNPHLFLNMNTPQDLANVSVWKKN